MSYIVRSAQLGTECIELQEKRWRAQARMGISRQCRNLHSGQGYVYVACCKYVQIDRSNLSAKERISSQLPVTLFRATVTGLRPMGRKA